MKERGTAISLFRIVLAVRDDLDIVGMEYAEISIDGTCLRQTTSDRTVSWPEQRLICQLQNPVFILLRYFHRIVFRNLSSLAVQLCSASCSDTICVSPFRIQSPFFLLLTSDPATWTLNMVSIHHRNLYFAMIWSRSMSSMLSESDWIPYNPAP